jgi:WXXGXW repeat (2 copies)
MSTKLLRCLLLTLMPGVGLIAHDPSALAQDAQNPPPVPAEELPAGTQVLTGGPVHEAFAKPVSMDPQAPILVPQQPPENLQEVPPAERPAGANIVWVPGYWAWDADRNDFIWVSGCWRNAPPNTYWVPGYWLQAGNGWEWIGGFWKPITAQPQQELEYLPAPPTSIEVAPPGAAPQPDQVWVPGCWYWSQGQYVPRHGYWITQQAGWVWVPSHFVWTPRGYIFAQGHWDHDMDDRGVLFCPAFFPREVRVRTGFVFSPGVCVDLGMLRLNLFVYPRYHHYYFGDYYDDAYVRVGILPWFKCQTVHTWYDPLFVYDRWHFQKADPHWAANLTRGFDLRRSNRDLRPARTYEELRVQMNRLPASRRPERPLVEEVKTYATSQHTPIKFERITTTERQQIAVKATDVHSLRDQRHQWEAPAARPAAVAEPKVNPRPASRAEAAQPPAQPVVHPGKSARAPAVVPPVRVTQPERVTVPSTPRMPQSAESRFIPKVPPSHPPQEQAHAVPAAPSRTPNHDSQPRPSSADSPSRDQRR